MIQVVLNLGVEKFMDRGYIRITRTGPTEAEQRDLLLQAGVAPEHLYVDDTTLPSHKGVESLKARASLIHDIRAGSRMVVSSLNRLGPSMQDILLAIAAITAKGCAVHVVTSGKTYEDVLIGQTAIDAMDAEAEQKRGRLGKARAVLAGRKVKRGPKPKLVGAAKDAARIDYDDVDQTIRAVAKKHGVSPTQLRRLFGERGIPRGRRPKQTPTE